MLRDMTASGEDPTSCISRGQVVLGLSKNEFSERICRVRPVKIITSGRITAKLENTLKVLGKLEKNGCYISQSVHNLCVVNNLIQ